MQLHRHHCHARAYPATLGCRPPVVRHCSRLSTASTSTASAAAAVVVDEVLKRTADTDGGLQLSDTQRDEVDQLLDQLEESGRGARPLLDERLWGHYEVIYTSTRRAKGQQGQPSGGRFRGALGRALFRTTGLFQSVFKVNEKPHATNKVAFKLFGCLPGYVGLRGVVQPHGDADDTVNVFFEPPVISLLGLVLRIGPKSSVRLTTTYLDERIRVGKGSYGSLFVFTRGGAADEADMESVGLEKTVSGLWAMAVLAVSAAVGAALWLSQNPILRGLACMTWLLTAGLAAVVRRGGTEDEPNTASTPLPASS